MTDRFFRFPHTSHLAWLGPGSPRDDKVLGPDDAAALLAGEVLVEEKLDGANLGLSTTEDGDLQAQNRGTYLQKTTAHPQFRPLWTWMTRRQDNLVQALWPDLILFGEWLHATHTVRYDRLPDWFVGFDVYDRREERFWDSGRRNTLLGQLGLRVVPELARGRQDLASLRALMGRSRFADGPLEGIVIRAESGGWTTGRAKLVRAEFTQAIEGHWSRGAIVANGLVAPR